MSNIKSEKQCCGAKRKCHDCKIPTTNYRCPDCLKKWRKNNGVSNNGVEYCTAGGPHRHNGIGAED